MSRYYLVGSNYDLYKKTYSNEVVIKEIDGIKLSSLAKIDSFTSKYDSLEIFEMIERELGVKSLNHLVVKYLKSDESKPDYYRVICKDELFNECINGLEEKTVNILGKTRRTLFVNRNSQIFKSQLSKLLEVLKSGNLDEFIKVYPKNNDFSLLVRRYLNASYDNDLYKERDLELILLEFSRYKTFRGWYVEQIKNKEKKWIKTNFGNNSNKFEKEKKVTIETYDEVMRVFDKDFGERNNMSYDQYRTLEHNTLGYGEDGKEEFLDVDEYNRMIDYDEDEIKKEFDEKMGNKRR